jgi:hypothetical protein
MKKIDYKSLINKEFYNWTIIGIGCSNKHQQKMLLCKCVCGFELYRRYSTIVNLKTKCCRKCLPNHVSGEKSKHRKGYKLIPGWIWWKIKNGAEKRGHEFDVSIKYIYDLYKKQKEVCALTGIPIYFAQNHHETKLRLTTASLDRIDNSKGYIKGNVWWIHKDINWMKQDYTKEEFIKYCCMVARKYNDDSQSTN